MLSLIYVAWFWPVWLVISMGYIVSNLVEGCRLDLPLIGRGLIIGGACAIAWPAVLGLAGFLYVVNHHLKEYQDDEDTEEGDMRL